MTVRFGIVGYGNIGRTHAQTLLEGEVAGAELTAVVDHRGVETPEGVASLRTLDDLLSADLADAVIVATPTFAHKELALAVVQAGKHLVVEKPIAMSLADAQQVIAAAPDGVQAAVMLNQRYHEAHVRIRELIANGDLGRLVRFNWLITTWYRPDVYFQVSSWRGTWPGEGGGALLNQCIHNLDVLQWWLGLPDSVVAQAQFGKFHDIEVEDEVTALLSYDNGLTGTLVASTGEAPGVNRLDIVGDAGSLTFDGVNLVVHRAHENVAEHCANTADMFGVPEFAMETVELAPTPNQHACVLRNVTAAIQGRAQLETPLAAGLGSIELANALLLAAWNDQRVSLPLDANTYQNALDARVSGSSLRTPKDIAVNIDMDTSYR